MFAIALGGLTHGHKNAFPAQRPIFIASLSPFPVGLWLTYRLVARACECCADPLDRGYLAALAGVATGGWLVGIAARRAYLSSQWAQLAAVVAVVLPVWALGALVLLAFALQA